MIKIETKRLIVRDYQESDLEVMHQLWSDPAIMYFLDDIMCHSIEDTAENLKNAMANADGHYFCFCDKATGAFMGSVGYTITDATPLGKIVHMGYLLFPKYGGKGYTTEAVEAVIKFAFEQDDCIRITTGCHAENVASYKVMEKVGFYKEAVRIKAVYHDGVMKDRLEYAINKDAYNANQSQLLDNLTENSSLTDVQNYIGKVLDLRGFSKETIQESMLIFLEEAGELAKAIRKTQTNMSVDVDKMQNYDTVESEAADVFVVLLAICNKLNINLFDALKEKERQNCKRNWSFER
ncbi:MAG: GNAT family N-acetyltransferase [Defluviitaleaceae bacterium]|nr:GNAT family N-acetyltransferase [Defluviitaleaceae bacterium]